MELLQFEIPMARDCFKGIGDFERHRFEGLNGLQSNNVIPTTPPNRGGIWGGRWYDILRLEAV